MQDSLFFTQKELKNMPKILKHEIQTFTDKMEAKIEIINRHG
jgi:hypothetical protein